MSQNNLRPEIQKALESQGYRGKIVSSRQVKALEEEILDRYHKGLIDETLYKEYRLDFDFDNPILRSESKSLIIVASPQPGTRVAFNLDGKTFPCLIPSTYCHDTDEKVQKILNQQMDGTGYSVLQVRVPLKYLAVCSGLARYGRNNIAYVEGMGSYFRLSAFYSDMPCSNSTWTEPKIHDLCEECTACLKACPTGAIPENRFLLRAERCITFHNETHGDFPQWIDPAWHNCLVGCIHCQRVCPLNKKVLTLIQKGPSFAHHETDALLEGLPTEKIPRETKAKIEKMDLTEYTPILGRNLRALMYRK